MDVRPITISTDKRGWFDTWRYPVVLVQEFYPCEQTNFLSFMADLDMFRDECAKERCVWLRESKAKTRCEIVYERYDTEDNVNVIFYRITLAFSNREIAEEYQRYWSDGNVS